MRKLYGMVHALFSDARVAGVVEQDTSSTPALTVQ